MNKIIEKLEAALEWGGTKKDVACLVISGAALILSLVGIEILPFDLGWIAILLCGLPIICEAIIGLITAFDIKADVLVSLALIACVCTGDIFAAGEVAFIMQIGGLLEELTVAKARAGIERLVQLTPQTARVLLDGAEKIIDAKDVALGAILRVFPGETIPVDGVIISGQTSINQAVMTGESLPVDKTVGDEVSSGTVNQFGAFEMKATKVGEDSSIQRMIRLVQTADASKAKIVGIADRWATWIVVIALTAAGITWAVTSEIIRAVTILVVFCPCALVLATPTAIMAAIGNVTKHGFLVREGDALERLAKVDRITFDKTGTLTYGKPEVKEIISFDETFNEKEILNICKAVEQYSEHPLGKAIISYIGEDSPEEIKVCKNFAMLPGRGVSGQVGGNKVCAGNVALLKAQGIELSAEQLSLKDEMEAKGAIVIYVAIDDTLIGALVLADSLRREAWAMIKSVKDQNITPVLLTGDNAGAASNIARNAGIKEYRHNCLPEDKLNAIADYQAKGSAVCMVGDGINDAPALKTANVGIAMGGIGSDIALDAADIVLIDDEVKELPHIFALSRRMMKTIKLNMTFSMGLNFLAIVLAMAGILNPVVGALVHNCGSVLVILNSAFLLRWKQ